MRVEVINTGTELMLGQVVNTHLRLLAEGLFPLGLRIERQVTVPDGSAIRDALAETFGRADLVLVTGGLGPTTDDITRDVVAELLGLELIRDESVVEAIAERFRRYGLNMSERTQLQALRPEIATVLPNLNGTAPGLYIPAIPARRSPHLFLLPGPPRELQPMFDQYALPLIATLRPAGPVHGMRNYRVAGLGESAVENLVGEPLLALGLELGYCARPGEVDLRVIASDEILDQAEAIIHEKLSEHIVSEDERSLEQVVVDLLTSRQETLATAESCTGGFLAHRLTNAPGASVPFVQGFVTYSNEAKARSLGVDPALIVAHGAVSESVARAMADGAREVTGADYALATTGIAGPGGGSEEKPVGTVYIALSSKTGPTIVLAKRFSTDRETFKFLTTQTALDLLRRSVLKLA